MKHIRDIENISGKRVFLRLDLNVPVTDGIVSDDFRIKNSFETIDFLLEKGAHLVIGSHFEGEGGSLKPVYEYLQKRYTDLVFVYDFFPGTPDDLSLKNLVLLENLRKYEGEKANAPEFAKHLASFADIYVNEAFPSSHRAHASIVGIPQYIPGYCGFKFEEEVTNLSRAFNPEHPFLFILGGAKFETKIPLVKKFFEIADSMFIGGAIANDFFRTEGIQTGESLLSKGDFNLSSFLTPKLVLPHDVVVQNGADSYVKKVSEVSMNEKIVDVGPDSVLTLKEKIQSAKIILWNGPLGNYEMGFKKGTLDLATMIADSSALSIVGGGDTVASIAELGLEDKFSFLSTAGGAMLDFLANGTLPGIEALK
jgi:phosphoglycerate kinase